MAVVPGPRRRASKLTRSTDPSLDADAGVDGDASGERRGSSESEETPAKLALGEPVPGARSGVSNRGCRPDGRMAYWTGAVAQ